MRDAWGAKRVAQTYMYALTGWTYHTGSGCFYNHLQHSLGYMFSRVILLYNPQRDSAAEGRGENHEEIDMGTDEGGLESRERKDLELNSITQLEELRV